MEEFEVLGQQRGFKLGTYTFKLINQLTGTKTIQDVMDRLQTGDEIFTCSFYFCCAKHWAMSKKLPIDFEEMEVAEWRDELGDPRLLEITTNLFKSYMAKKKIAPVVEEIPQ